jgi:outer membrane phospholipase A
MTTESVESLRKRALALYKPPFKFQYGYIYDSEGNVVADNSSERDEEVTCSSAENGNLLLRVRGWGRIGYMENPEQLQDTVGELIVEALNAYWEKSLKDA